MPITEILLIGAIILLIIISIFDKSKQKVLTKEISLNRTYYETIILLWLPVIFLVNHITFSILTFEIIGLVWSNHWRAITGFSLLALLTIYFIYDLFSLVKDEKAQQKLAEQMQSLAWFMPKTKKQMFIFTIGLSVSAGICEELIFRGYILHELSEYFGVTLAVILSSALFGLCHFYQGVFNVIRTFIIGIVFCLVYLSVETLIIPIILHILLDVYGGISSYIVRNSVKVDKCEVNENETDSLKV